MPAQALHEVGAAEDETGLRPTEQLVATGVTIAAPAASQRRSVGLVRQRGIGLEQTGADVGDDRDAERGQLIDSRPTS